MPDLSGFPALDVAIGLFFLYFLLSTISSSINEAIANLLGWRAKTLEDAIRSLVDDPKVRRGWKEWFGRVHKKGLEKGSTVESKRDDVTVAADLTSELFDHWRIRALVRLPDPRFDVARAPRTCRRAPSRSRSRRRWRRERRTARRGPRRGSRRTSRSSPE